MIEINKFACKNAKLVTTLTFAIALIVRIILLLYGAWQDENSESQAILIRKFLQVNQSF